MQKPYLILIAGLLLFLPSLWAGFLLDDYYCLEAAEGEFAAHDTDRSLFAPFINDEAATARMAERGFYPWWIDEGIRSLLLRPLSDLLFRFDHAVWGRSAFGYHLHSLIWWALALAACGLVLRRALPGAIGVLALLLFALDDVHVMPVAWIANRNALVAIAPLLWGLWAWLRWREDGWRAGRFLGPAGIVIGMLGGELALAGLAYFLAYELLGRPTDSRRSRLAGLLPVVGLGIAYVVLYRLLGCGGAGSGLYFDPMQNPAGYLAAAVTRIPTLLASGIVGFTADLWITTPALRPVQVVIGCGALLVLLGLLRVCWPALDDATRRGLRWLLAGSLLSLPPVVATFPSDRMLLVPGIGLVAAVATVIATAFRVWRKQRRRLLTAIGGVLAFMHLIMAPLFAVFVQSLLIDQSRKSLELAASPVVRDSASKQAVLIFAPDHVVALYLPLLIDHLGQPTPASWRPLSIAPCDHRLRRTGPRTLELETVGGVMMRGIFEVLYRDPKERITAGTVIDRGLFAAEILEETVDGPTRVAFHFDRDLADPSLRFLIWLGGKLRPARLPDVGEDYYIARTLGPAGF